MAWQVCIWSILILLYNIIMFLKQCIQNGQAVKITFGFGNSTTEYGIMMYNKNRLIKAYEKIGCQKQVFNIL